MPVVIFIEVDGSPVNHVGNVGERMMELARRSSLEEIMGDYGGNATCATCAKCSGVGHFAIQVGYASGGALTGASKDYFGRAVLIATMLATYGLAMVMSVLLARRANRDARLAAGAIRPAFCRRRQAGRRGLQTQ